MPEKINPIVKDAIIKACRQNGQTDDVAKKLVAWVEASYVRELDATEKQYFAAVVVDAINLGDCDGY